MGADAGILRFMVSRMKNQIIPTVAASCLLTLTCLAPSQAAPAAKVPAANKAGAQQPDKHQIVSYWADYFQSLRSLETHWEIKSVSSDPSEKKRSYKYGFLWKPQQFRIDTDFVSGRSDPRNYWTSIHGFDGKFHRSFSLTGEGNAKLNLMPDMGGPESWYGMSFPLLNAFSFVLGKNDSYRLDTLRDGAIWQRLERRISKVTRGQWLDKKGAWLDIEMERAGAAPMRVFVDDVTHLPLYSSGARHFERDGKPGLSDSAVNFRITRVMPWRDGAKNFFFPLDSEGREWTKSVEDGAIKRAFAQYSDRANAPAVINAPITLARFEFEIPAKTFVSYNAVNNDYEDSTVFFYDPKGGTLAVQTQREQQRIEDKRRALAAMPPIYDEKADGKLQIAEAIAQAKTGGKRVLLQFGANWCGPCHELHDLLEQDAAIASALKRGYIVANIDVNDGHNEDLFLRYTDGKGSGIPFLVMLDDEGKVMPSPDSESFNETADNYDAAKLAAFFALWMPAEKQNS